MRWCIRWGLMGMYVYFVHEMKWHCCVGFQLDISLLWRDSLGINFLLLCHFHCVSPFPVSCLFLTVKHHSSVLASHLSLHDVSTWCVGLV